jgi:hypothetical protein
VLDLCYQIWNLNRCFSPEKRSTVDVCLMTWNAEAIVSVRIPLHAVTPRRPQDVAIYQGDEG